MSGNKVDFLASDAVCSLDTRGLYKFGNKYFETGFDFNVFSDMPHGFGNADVGLLFGASENGGKHYNNLGLDVNLNYNFEHDYGYVGLGLGAEAGYAETYTGGETTVEQTWGSYYHKYYANDGKTPAISMTSGPVYTQIKEPKHTLTKGMYITPKLNAEAGFYVGDGIVSASVTAGKDKSDKFVTTEAKFEYPIDIDGFEGSISANAGYTWNNTNNSSNWRNHQGAHAGVGFSLIF